jgi:hypothetical protein
VHIILVIAATASPVLALLGVWLGARLGSLQENRRWLRDQRLQTYVEYLDHLVEVTRVFSVGMKVSNLQRERAQNSGHDFTGVENSFQDLMSDLEHLDQRLELIMGHNVSEALQDVHGVILMMTDARDDENATEELWNEITEESWAATSNLQEAMRTELGVKRLNRSIDMPSWSAIGTVNVAFITKLARRA